MLGEAHHIRTPDFIHASILRALGARLVDVERGGARVCVVLDLSGIADAFEHNIRTLLRELEAGDALDNPTAAADLIIANTFLGTITASHSDLKRRT